MPVELTYFQAIVLGVVEGLTEFLPISLHRTPDHRRAAARAAGRRPGGHRLHRDHPDRRDRRDVHLLLAQDRPAVPRLGRAGCARREAPRGPRLHAGLGRHRRLAARRHRRLPGARPHLRAAAQPVGGRRGADPVERRHLGRGAAARRPRARGDPARRARRSRSSDGLVIGLVQCFSLIPGVSRSGATISAGLMRGIDRVTATELSFFMAIPALTAAGIFELARGTEAVLDLGVGPDARRHRRRLRHGLRLDRLAAALRRDQLAAAVHLVPRGPRPAPSPWRSAPAGSRPPDSDATADR